MNDTPIDDGSRLPLGQQTPDGELEVRENGDGTRGFHETDLGQHQRWMRQAPDLYEKYHALLAERAASPHVHDADGTAVYQYDGDDCVICRRRSEKAQPRQVAWKKDDTGEWHLHEDSPEWCQCKSDEVQCVEEG